MSRHRICVTLETLPAVLSPQLILISEHFMYSIYVYIFNIITQAWVYLMINLAKKRVFFGGICNRIYDCSSEMVPEQFFGLYVFFLRVQANKPYSGISMQYATCWLSILTPFNISCRTKAEKISFCVRNGGTLISIEKVEN